MLLIGSELRIVFCTALQSTCELQYSHAASHGNIRPELRQNQNVLNGSLTRSVGIIRFMRLAQEADVLYIAGDHFEAANAPYQKCKL